MGVSGRAMIEALIAGQRDPLALASLAKGRLRVKHDALVQALTGQFSDHHGELAQILLDQVGALTAQIDHLTARIDQMIAAIPAAQGVDADGSTGPNAGTGPGAAVLAAITRLDEIPGIGARAAQIIIAEIGLDMSVFPTPGHLVVGPSSAHARTSPAPRTGPGKPARATPTSRASWARSPPQRPRPNPSWANATGAWSNGAESSRPWSPWPDPSWSSSGTCYPSPRPASMTSGPTSTTTASAPNGPSATTRQLEALGHRVTLEPAA